MVAIVATAGNPGEVKYLPSIREVVISKMLQIHLGDPISVLSFTDPIHGCWHTNQKKEWNK
jgi:hypothetical protein